MHMHTELTRNVPGNPDWIGSFYETLSEHGVWSENEYRILIRELKSLADKNKDEKLIEKTLPKLLLILQAKVLNLISSHFDRNDVYEISNLNMDEVLDKKEEFVLAVQSVVS